MVVILKQFLILKTISFFFQTSCPNTAQVLYKIAIHFRQMTFLLPAEKLQKRLRLMVPLFEQNDAFFRSYMTSPNMVFNYKLFHLNRPSCWLPFLRALEAFL